MVCMNIERYSPSVKEGLSLEQVEQRKLDNLINYNAEPPTKSIEEIIKSNVFSYFIC